MGTGCADLPIGDPGLHAFPLEIVPFLNASKESENKLVKTPDFIRNWGDVGVPHHQMVYCLFRLNYVDHPLD